MILKDKHYNFLKWFLILFIPNLILLINGLGSLLNYDVSLITGIISLIASFIGGITKISDKNYKELNK